MAVLSSQRSTAKFPPEGVLPDVVPLGVAAGAKIWAGGIVVTNAAGYAIPASTAGGVLTWGRAEPAQNAAGAIAADNTSGSAGAITLQVRQGCFKYISGTSGDLIASTNAGSDCYVIDDITVGLTDGGGTRIRAGKIIQVDADGGVWVLMGAFLRDVGSSSGQSEAAGSVISIPLQLSQLANSQVLALTPGFTGRVKAASILVTTPATTAAKAATLTVQVGGVSVTGGVLSLTSANFTPAGTVLTSTAITAGNGFSASQTVGVVASSVTAFVEGQGTLLLTLA